MSDTNSSKLCNYCTRAALLNCLLFCCSGISSSAARHLNLRQFTASGCRQHFPLSRPRSPSRHRRGHDVFYPLAFASCSTRLRQGHSFHHLSHPLLPSSFNQPIHLSQHTQVQKAHLQPLHQQQISPIFTVTTTKLYAAPKRGNVVNTYQTVSVNCSSCKHRLFRYKKKNGTKSNLIKCYVERIVGNDKYILDESDVSSSEAIDGNSDNDAVDDINDGASGLLKHYYEKKKEMEEKHGRGRDSSGEVIEMHCPKCGVNFARSAVIKGRPAWKLVGGKTRMTKK